jgi:hypothetical protein
MAAIDGTVQEFVFADPAYKRDRSTTRTPFPTNAEPVVRVASEISEPDRQRNGNSEMPGRRWAMEWSRTVYRKEDGRDVVVVCDSRHASEVLAERFPPRSIGVFMHRGDGAGEGGSALSFLDPGKRSPDCFSYHIDSLAKRLADRALVVTDGSNTEVAWLAKFYASRRPARGACFEAKEVDHEMAGFHWTCVGWLGRRYGPTLVWGIERLDRA